MASPVCTTLGKVQNTPAEQLAFGPNNWEIHDTETNGACAATLVGVVGCQHFVRQVFVSFDAVPAAICILTVKSGSTDICPPINIGVGVIGPVVITFPVALQCTQGATLNVDLTSPGNIKATIGAIGFSSPDQTAYAAS